MTPRLPWVLATVTVVMLIAMLVLSLGKEELFDTLLRGTLALTLATIGALIASRQPANPIGWIFCGLGVWASVTETWEAFAYNGLPTAEAGEWVISWSWVCDVTAFTLVFLLFPNGRLLDRRWRRVVWLLLLGGALAVTGQALSADNATDFASGRNPLAVDSVAVEAALTVGTMMVLVALIAAIASVVIRYRRAVGVERLQLRQLVFAGGVIVPTMVAAGPFYYDSVVVRVALEAAMIALPTAAGLAILRYRLYDIDVVINRTLVYGALTATLAATYLGSVLLLQVLLAPLTEQSDLAIAGSTLAVAGLFRPARRRIQAAVDRSFFRSRYDAVRTLESFGARLRDEVDIDALGEDLRTVVAETMQPAHASLWLREPEPGR